MNLPRRLDAYVDFLAEGWGLNQADGQNDRLEHPSMRPTRSIVMSGGGVDAASRIAVPRCFDDGGTRRGIPRLGDVGKRNGGSGPFCTKAKPSGPEDH